LDIGLECGSIPLKEMIMNRLSTIAERVAASKFQEGDVVMWEKGGKKVETEIKDIIFKGGKWIYKIDKTDEPVHEIELKAIIASKRVAKTVVASGPEEAYVFATKIADVAGVTDAAVNDWAVLSHNPTVYEVDIHVYISPEIGGVMTNRLKSQGDRIARAMGIRMVSFYSPRADRRMDEVGMAALRQFYTENPYKITVRCTGDE
jgi:hypothetical protein